jgi:hypothetical protein
VPQGKCSFCGTFVTSGGTPMGKNAVACRECTPLAVKWLEKHGEPAAVGAEGDQPAPPEEKPGD